MPGVNFLVQPEFTAVLIGLGFRREALFLDPGLIDDIGIQIAFQFIGNG